VTAQINQLGEWDSNPPWIPHEGYALITAQNAAAAAERGRKPGRE
jgi:hypothetical protein